MKSNRSKLPVIFAIVGLLLGLVLFAGADRSDTEGAAVSGVIKFDGPVPERTPIGMRATIKQKGVGTPDECIKLHKEPVLSEDAIVSEDGEIANVFIYVKKGLDKKVKYPVPTEPAFSTQTNCMFRPRVLGVRVGQEVFLRNGDPLLHNVRSYGFKNRTFNIAQPADSKDRKRVFKRPEGPIKIGCDIHKWMAAYLFAMDHPFFAVSNEKGQFKITGLPAGEYTLAAWHEEYGEQEAKVTVGSTGTVNVGFTFKPKG